jgi:ATP-dependent exoDNAse (exonuclease V) beta subunit
LAQFDEEGERDSSHPIEKEFRAIENKKEVAESMRLLYVALTRARERLCLVELGPSEPMPEELYAREFWRGWMSVAGISKTEWKTESAQALRALGPEKRPKLEPVIPLDPVPMYRPRYSVTEWLELAQCERRFEWSRVRPRAVPPKQEGEREAEDSEIVAFNTRAESQSSSTQSASQRGTELHAELAALGKRFENWSTRSGTYALARYPALGAWIGKEKSRLAQDSEVSTFTEFGFEAMVGSELIAGTIDRFEVKTSGSVAHVRLIDYKLVGRGPFRERSDTEFAENYRIQLSLYAHAIRALMLGQARGEHVDLEISAELLLISQDGVRSVPVTLAPEVALLDLANRARVIVEGEAGVARPGTHCRYCPVAEICEQKKADD